MSQYQNEQTRAGTGTGPGGHMPPSRDRTVPMTGGRVIDFGARATIVDEGEQARAVYMVVFGTVMLSKLLPDGRRQIFEVIGQNELFGITPNARHECAAETLSEARILAFDRSLAERSSEFESLIARHLKARICALHDHALLLGRKSAVERVASYVLDLTEAATSGARASDLIACVRVPMTRSEIADYLGLTLETVSRAFSRMKRDGVLAYDRHDGPMQVNVRRLRPLTGTF